MKPWLPWLARLLLGLLAACILTDSGWAQQPFRPSSTFAYDSHVFRRMLKDQHLEPLKSWSQLQDDPATAVLVVLGNTRCLDQFRWHESLSAFVEKGGAVLIASDMAPGEHEQEQLEEAAAVTIEGKIYWEDPNRVSGDLVYKGKGFCPFLLPTLRGTPNLFQKPGLDPAARLKRVATNAPSCLVAMGELPEGIHRLAWLPPGAIREGLKENLEEENEGNEVQRRAFELLYGQPYRHGPLFGVGGERGTGKILVLADHSLFINQMMLPEDNGNVEFTYNCLAWLRDAPASKKRGQVLFVENGTIRTDFDVPLKDVPLPAGADRALVAALDESLADLEKQNALNRGLWKWLMQLCNDEESLLWRRVVESATVLLLALLAWRITARGRHRLDRAVPLLTHEVARHLPEGSLMEQRCRAALRAGTLWEAARGLAREWIMALGLPNAGTRPPRVHVPGNWWRQWRLQRRCGRLWRLAHAQRPVRVSPRAFRRLVLELDQLKTDVAHGTVTFK